MIKKVAIRQPIKVVKVLRGPAGADGDFIYIAYASDDLGTDFSTTFDPTLIYTAILRSTTEIATPEASDFAGLWFKSKGDDGTGGVAEVTFSPDGVLDTFSHPDFVVGEFDVFYNNHKLLRDEYTQAAGSFTLPFVPAATDTLAAWIYGGDWMADVAPVSQGDAEAGTSETVYLWSPLRIFQAIVAKFAALGGVTAAATLTDTRLVRGSGSRGIAETPATIDENGSINIPAGQQYLVNNVPLITGGIDWANPVAVTGAVTLTIGKHHACSGTSADYTVVLPDVAASVGQLVSVAALSSMTKLLTIIPKEKTAIAGTVSFGNGNNTAGTGTVSTSGSSTTVTGVGTSFTSQLKVGDWIHLNTTNGDSRIVSAIASDTSLTVTSAVTASAGTSFTYTSVGLVGSGTNFDPELITATTSTRADFVVVDNSGNLEAVPVNTRSSDTAARLARPFTTGQSNVAAYTANKIIDGFGGRILLPGESCVLYSDGTTWKKVAGSHCSLLGLVGVKSILFASGNITKINSNTVAIESFPGFFHPGLRAFVAIREGWHALSTYNKSSPNNASSNVQWYTLIGVNGGYAHQSFTHPYAGSDYKVANIYGPYYLPPGSHVEHYGLFYGGSFTTSTTDSGVLNIEERDKW